MNIEYSNRFVEGRIKDEWMQHYDASQKTFREKVTIEVSTFTNVLHNTKTKNNKNGHRKCERKCWNTNREGEKQ